MKRLNFILTSMIIVAVAFTACVSQKSSVPGVTAIRSLPGNDIYQADLDIPQIDGTPLLNTMISDQINGWYDSFISEAELNRQMAEEYGQPFTFENQWKVALNNAECVSVLLTAYQFTGGANGVDKMASFTWNKQASQLMTLEQLLPLVLAEPTLSSLAQICREELTDALAAGNDPDLREMILTGTEPVPANYKIFTISDKGLTIYFEKYQVAPGSSGSQAVLIPYLK